MLGYATIAETGLLILIMGSRSSEIVNLTFLILIPRGLALAVWALALSIIKRKAYTLRFNEVQGLARTYPITSAALILAHLSMTGFPLLAGFPARLAIWQELAAQSLSTTVWAFVGMLGLLIAAIRKYWPFLVMVDEEKKWSVNEFWVQMTMLGLGSDRAFHPRNVPTNLAAISSRPTLALQSHWSIRPFVHARNFNHFFRLT